MAMASQTEDPSVVLEQFIQDVANLPAEIAHLLEEVQAKDDKLSQLRSKIYEQDLILQKHIKSKGALVKHEREDSIMKAVGQFFNEAQTIQEEKVALSNKAAYLLDRHVKRLDLKIRDLQSEGAVGPDSSLPSLLHDSHANRVRLAPVSGPTAGLGGVQASVQASTNGAPTNVANAAMAQMLNRAGPQAVATGGAPAAAMQPNPLLSGTSNGTSQRRRDVSAGGATDVKRRRLNASLGPLPSATAAIQRHSSLGPSTPKAGTPTASRAGSAGPRMKKPAKKIPPHVQSMRKKHGKIGLSKSSARRLHANKKGTPSSTGDDESNEEDGSDEDEDTGSAAAGREGAADEDEMDVVVQDDDADDSKLYCFCKSVSHGDMVACDNEDCPHEWFHWECVGLTQEPKGRWLCEHCRKLPQSRIKLAR